MRISRDWLRDVCKIGKGASCCRYVAVGEQGFRCLKGTRLQSLLDKKAVDKEIVAQSNNCAGLARAN